MAKQKKGTKPALIWNSNWEYSPAPESAKPAAIAKKYELFIDGKWQQPVEKKYFKTINPATEEVLSEV
ncbi:MAG: betaine-aldehyde dehydrogenase, partial [Chitinophagia bacterium]|nr:betaine-aldehyde dehydrogenase [Chitinophagia bacterium]